MDEDGLRLYGIGSARLWLIMHVLRKKFYDRGQVAVTLLYGLYVTACFLLHDVWFEDYASVAFLGQEPNDEIDLLQKIIFVVELVFLGLFTLDLLLHSVGFGLLFLRPVPLISGLFVCGNLALLFVLRVNKSLLGIKLLIATILFFVRLEGSRVKLA